jgi:hypothetical protein
MDLPKAFMEARHAVEAANLPENMQSVAFEKALDVLLTQSTIDPTTRAGNGSLVESDDTEGSRTETAVLERIAKRLGVAIDQIRQVYFLADDELGLSISSATLSGTTKEAARQIALLIAVGRQAGKLDSDGWTHASEIRRVCDHYGKFDVGNFGRTLREMDDVFQDRKSVV